MHLFLKVTLFVSCVVLAQAKINKVRLCVDDAKSLEKCQALSEALKAEKSEGEFSCVSDKDCTKSVVDGKSDATIHDSHMHPSSIKDLEAVLFESYKDKNLIVALVDADKESKIKDLPLSYSKKTDDSRLVHSALYFNHYRNDGKCIKVVRPSEEGSILLERYHEIKDTKNKKLVCIQNGQLVTKPISEYKTCHVESDIPNAVMVKRGSKTKDEVTKAFLTAAKQVGNGSQFQLFGPFKGTKNLIFNDETVALVPNHSEPNGVTVESFVDIHCGVITNHDHAHDNGHEHSIDHDHSHDNDHKLENAHNHKH